MIKKLKKRDCSEVLEMAEPKGFGHFFLYNIT